MKKYPLLRAVIFFFVRCCEAKVNNIARYREPWFITVIKNGDLSKQLFAKPEVIKNNLKIVTNKLMKQ